MIEVAKLKRDTDVLKTGKCFDGTKKSFIDGYWSVRLIFQGIV